MIEGLFVMGGLVMFFALAGFIFDSFWSVKKITKKQLDPFVHDLWIAYQKEYDKGTWPGSKKKYQTKEQFINNNLPFIINKATEKGLI